MLRIDFEIVLHISSLVSLVNLRFEVFISGRGSLWGIWDFY